MSLPILRNILLGTLYQNRVVKALLFVAISDENGESAFFETLIEPFELVALLVVTVLVYMPEMMLLLCEEQHR
jgi:hypothetical protein